MPATHSSPALQCVSNVENNENHFEMLEHILSQQQIIKDSKLCESGSYGQKVHVGMLLLVYMPVL